MNKSHYSIVLDSIDPLSEEEVAVFRQQLIETLGYGFIVRTRRRPKDTMERLQKRLDRKEQEMM